MMSLGTLVRRSLAYHWRAHLGVLLGAVVGSAVLIGALLVGDSVRASLKKLALLRLGQTEQALASNDRFFRSALAGEISAEVKTPVTPIVQVLGTASARGGKGRANKVQVQGVENGFWDLAQKKPSWATIPDGSVVLNEGLARQLGVKEKEDVVFRVPKPSALSRDAPLASQEDASAALRVTVHAIVTDEEFGRFGLQASQLPPFNAFMPIAWLQQRLDIPGKANLLLVGKGEANGDQLTAALRKHWQIADAQIELRDLADAKAIEIRTPRVFLDSPMAQASEKAGANGKKILTYFANDIRLGTNSVPYSMVTAAGEPWLPAGIKEDEIVLGQWAADDLSAKAGDIVTMTYYFVGIGRKLEERTNTFRVHSVVPLSGIYADRSLMPDFPGMTDAENCRDWDTGFPIKMDAITDKDEKYWDDHKGTPKAFISLAAGQKLWSNRFGDLTAVRYDSGSMTTNQLAQAIQQQMDPASVSLSFLPVREQALKAVDQSQDFGGLFIGFSFFLIVAALLLMALLFQLGVEQRAREVGTLLAFGFTPKQVRNLLLGEGSAIALIGGVLGAVGGIWYARGMLYGLANLWRDAVGTSSLAFHAQPQTLVIGTVASFFVALITIWLAVRKQVQRPARELLAEGAEERRTVLEGSKKSKAGIIATVCIVLGLVMVVWAKVGGDGGSAAGLFFGAGGLFLIGGLAASAAWLNKLRDAGLKLSADELAAQFHLNGLGIRNAVRRRKRSLATISLLACGSFLVVAVGANKLNAIADAGKRSAGTGGFAFIGDTTLPVVHDLNVQEGREFFGLDDKKLKDVSLVPFRVKDGDDASCLNLNRAQTPRLLGVNPLLLQERKAFTFAKLGDGVSKEEPWLALKASVQGDEVPAIGDFNSIMWAMGKKVGDTLDFRDERGQVFKVRIVGAVANSILQGNLLIDEAALVAKYPSESGHRMFLIDTPAERAKEVSATLTKALQNEGLELTSTAQRLNAFNAVQNTYLSTFQILGGLGLLLGSLGLGVVVLRNVLERRGELALMQAIGFRAQTLKWLVISEHGVLLLVGLAVGVISALIAVLPALLSPGAEIPYASLAMTLGAVLLSGGVWTLVAAAFALRGQLLNGLRSE
ncbi:MAG TPA: ABC transporter permease [Verrucomicrobiae bacterium]